MKMKMEEYLAKSYGNQGKSILANQQQILKKCINQIKEKSESQRKTMIKKILPRIALYKALLIENRTKEEAIRIVGDYLVFELSPTAKMYQRMDRSIPFFFLLFKKVFLNEMKSDAWVSKNYNVEKNSFSFDIVDCLWYNTCVENDCPELCVLFCNNDDLFYGNLFNTRFKRNGTIAKGSEKCDFHFENGAF